MTSSSPGGQWLPFRGHDAVTSLSHPLRTPSFLPYPEVVGSNPKKPKTNFTSNLLRENCSKQCLFLQVDWFLSFESCTLLLFFNYPTFISKLFHFFTYPMGLGNCTYLLSWLSFLHFFLNSILSAVLCDLWKTIELLSTSFFQIPSLIARLGWAA